MKHLSFVLSLMIFSHPTVAISGWFSPDNYWECLLDELQNIQSDTIAEEAVELCKNNFPFHERIFITKKTAWFGPKTAGQCVIKYGKKIKTEVGARYLQSACYKLYPDN